MATATRNKRNSSRKVNEAAAQALDVTPNEVSFNTGYEDDIPQDEPEDTEIEETEDTESADPAQDSEDYVDPNEGGEVETEVPGTGANGRALKYVYPAGIVTQKQKQSFRRQQRALKKKGGDISQALKNPSAAGKTPQGRTLLKQALPNCERCGEPGDTAMAVVLPGDFLDHLTEQGEAHMFPVHKNSCMLPTDITLV